MDLKRASRFISLVLRHKPEEAGVTLDQAGWCNIEHLLNGLDKRGYRLSHNDLFMIVDTDEKKRYSISPDHRSIRANQGHSVTINLGLVAQAPPPMLYHGTASKSAEAIRVDGIKKMSRQHVHLSSDVETATTVGARHGSPAIFLVDSGKMAEDGYEFFISENGVWLTDFVPATYLSWSN